MLGNRPSKAYLHTIIIGEMYPVRLCLHILPDVLLHDDSRLLVGPPSSVQRRSVSLYADPSQEEISWGFLVIFINYTKYDAIRKDYYANQMSMPLLPN